MIPMEIGEMRFLRKCRTGEQITLEARMRAQDEEGLAWDARGIDDQGRTIMQIRGIADALGFGLSHRSGRQMGVEIWQRIAKE